MATISEKPITLVRRVSFSSGHRYWKSDLSEAENKALFGSIASPYNHGHNYVLDASFSGLVEPETGMVVNIKRIDDLLKSKVSGPLNNRSLNDEIPHFQSTSPSLENLLDWIYQQLCSEGGLTHVHTGLNVEVPVTITRIRLEEMPTLWAELEIADERKMITITRAYEFAASHRLHAAGLSPETNIALYGKCNHVHGHGHNYGLEVTVTGKLDPVSGMMVDLGALDAVVERLILDRYDHRNLDLDVPELSGQITTSENVAAAIFLQLNGNVPGELVKIRLLETARNAFEVTW